MDDDAGDVVRVLVYGGLSGSRPLSLWCGAVDSGAVQELDR